MMPNVISLQTANITTDSTIMPITPQKSFIDTNLGVADNKMSTTLEPEENKMVHDYPIGSEDYDYGYSGYLYDYNESYPQSCPNETGSMDVMPSYRICIHILLPIICTIGIVGITLTVIVLSRKNMSTSTNNYLISLAIMDLCFLILMGAKCFETQFSRDEYYTYIFAMAYAQVFQAIFLMASVWLTVMLAVERYIAICHPLRAMSICTVVRARIIIISIFLITFACCLPLFFRYNITSFHHPCINKTVYMHEISELGQNELFRQIYSWGDCFLSAILPFSALLFLNGCLIREIHRSTTYLRYHLASDSNVQTIITSEEIKITMMLVSVVVVFFTCEAPYVLLLTIKRLKPDKVFPHFNILTYVTILLLVLRSSFNFILYCWFSEKFWNTFKRTFCMPNCILSRAPSWFRSRIGNNSEHGHSNNNRKISYFNTKETIC